MAKKIQNAHTLTTDELYSMRHSAAHVLASAISELWPGAKFGVGPVVDNGFYYDIDMDYQVSVDDLGRISQKMNEISLEDQPFNRFELPIAAAIQLMVQEEQPYKVELLRDLQQHGTTNAKDISIIDLGVEKSDVEIATVSFYRNGDFTDLCRGPHVDSTSKIGAFKLMRVSGAYWRGNQNNTQMQRIYGVAFTTKQELDNYLELQIEAEKRDHRKLGNELDLFVFSDLVGPGLPLWTPKGTVLRRQLDNFVQEMRDEYGFLEVAIPHITKKDLYIKSGHWAKFNEELFKITTREGHEFAMKPMNCPHHTQIYASRPRSYRDLPIRYRETTMVYRDEQSGELGGLSRVRAITQDDAHVFCRSGQIEAEVLKLWDIVERFYLAFGLGLRLRLSVHDSSQIESYAGSTEAWASAEDQLRSIAESKLGDDYELGVGEAAFYGPKLDFMAKDALGREFQVATIQLDFNQPEGFDLNCTNEGGASERIVMIHCAIMGSIDRFLSILIEHTAGKFPLWLSPVQVQLITVNATDEMLAYATGVASDMKGRGLRVEVDSSNESVGKKIRASELAKVPYAIVLGDKEKTSNKVTPRIRKDLVAGEPVEYSMADFIKTVAHEAKSRTSKSSL